jgi:PncC family amidohydrolase
MSTQEDLAAYMKRHGLVLTTAESCTAGLIAAHLADVEGAGALLESAFVVYAPKAKQRCLGVSAEILARHNLTSEAVAAAMARGALERTDANLVIANTGVTDDTDPDIPAGTQCFAWLFRGNGCDDALYTETRRFSGDRNQVRDSSADYALQRVSHYHARCRAVAASDAATSPSGDD